MSLKKKEQINFSSRLSSLIDDAVILGSDPRRFVLPHSELDFPSRSLV
jgi:hypothetical protein